MVYLGKDNIYIIEQKVLKASFLEHEFHCGFQIILSDIKICSNNCF